MIERHAWAAYLAVAVAAEIALPFNPMITALIDSAVLVLVLSHFGWAQRSPLAIGEPGIRLLPAVALLPLLRVLSITMPVPELSPIVWLALAAGPLLFAVVSTARLTDIDVREIGIGVIPRDAWSGVLIAASIPVGILLGWLQPSFLSIDRDAALAVGLAAATLVAGSAIAEELVFRGILQPLMGRAIGPIAIVLTAGVYGATYLGSQSLAVAGIMAVVGLAYGWVVARSGSLWGPLLGHSALILAAIFLAPIILPSA
jgi:membrane protease YdiL (CAAX protease family)